MRKSFITNGRSERSFSKCIWKLHIRLAQICPTVRYIWTPIKVTDGHFSKFKLGKFCIQLTEPSKHKIFSNKQRNFPMFNKLTFMSLISPELSEQMNYKLIFRNMFRIINNLKQTKNNHKSMNYIESFRFADWWILQPYTTWSTLVI